MFQLKFGNKKLGEVNENRVKWKNLQKEEIYAAGNILFGVKSPFGGKVNFEVNHFKPEHKRPKIKHETAHSTRNDVTTSINFPKG